MYCNDLTAPPVACIPQDSVTHHHHCPSPPPLPGYILKAFVKSTFTTSVPLVLDSLTEVVQLAKAYSSSMAPPPTTATATTPAAAPEPTAPTNTPTDPAS